MPNIPREIRLCQPIDYLYGEGKKERKIFAYVNGHFDISSNNSRVMSKIPR